MITLNTVFVLGAGASVPYNFPNGVKLSQEIINGLAPRSHLWELLTACNFAPSELDQFQFAFSRSAKSSVDAFLEHRIEFMDVGKAAIASVLIGHEREKSLFKFDANWMRIMFDRMSCKSLDTFSQNQVSFVTFNYDRSLEHFLFTSLQHAFGKSQAECAEQLEYIPIIHLHGSLGELPWQGSNGRPYDIDTSPANISIAAKNIKIIHEDTTDGRDKDFERAKDLMTKADRVYFMGFGFAPTNVERLGVRHLAALRNKTFSTGLGLSPREMRDITHHLCGANIEFRPDEDCTTLLRNSVDWF